MAKIMLNGVDYSAPVSSGVSGVKGNAETSYRTGNVNITPANIGLGNVNNTADSDKNVLSAINIKASNGVNSACMCGNALVPKYQTSSSLGNGSVPWNTIHGDIIYENGKALSSQYTTKSQVLFNGELVMTKSSSYFVYSGAVQESCKSYRSLPISITQTNDSKPPVPSTDLPNTFISNISIACCFFKIRVYYSNLTYASCTDCNATANARSFTFLSSCFDVASVGYCNDNDLYAYSCYDTLYFGANCKSYSMNIINGNINVNDLFNVNIESRSSGDIHVGVRMNGTTHLADGVTLYRVELLPW